MCHQIINKAYQNKHGQYNKIKCDFCQMVYETRQSLFYHIKTIHAAKGNQCQFCPKVYKTCLGLMNHLKSHLEIKESK